MTTATVIRDATVLTLDEKDTLHPRADIVIEGGLIRAVGQGAAASAPPGAQVIDGTGHLVIPGLINGHFHSPGNFMKGALENWPLELFMLYEVPPLMDRVATPRFAYLRTMLGIIEMLKQGVTAVHDDCFYVPVVTEDEVDAVMQAYADAGEAEIENRVEGDDLGGNGGADIRSQDDSQGLGEAHEAGVHKAHQHDRGSRGTLDERGNHGSREQAAEAIPGNRIQEFAQPVARGEL